MKKFLFILLVFITVKVFGQGFTINSPTANQVVTGSTLYVAGYVYGGNLTQRVVSVTNGRTDTLSLSETDPNYPFGYYQYFSKSIPVAGFPLGVPIKLKLTGTNVNGFQWSDSVNYSVTPPVPTASILQPLAGTSAYPSLHVKTSHTGTDPALPICRLKLMMLLLLRIPLYTTI